MPSIQVAFVVIEVDTEHGPLHRHFRIAEVDRVAHASSAFMASAKGVTGMS